MSLNKDNYLSANILGPKMYLVHASRHIALSDNLHHMDIIDLSNCNVGERTQLYRMQN